MNLIELVLASVFYAVGGLFMKLSAGLTRPGAALAFSIFFVGGACLQALGIQQRDLGMATILVLGVEALMTLSCGRSASAGSTATRSSSNNARYVEYCGAGECVGLYYICIQSYLTPDRHHREGLKVCGLADEGERIRTFGSAMRSHRRQRGRGVMPPDPGGEWRLLGPPPDTSIGVPRPAVRSC
jgi:hypothetical protein